jgi:hypothetical protein
MADGHHPECHECEEYDPERCSLYILQTGYCADTGGPCGQLEGNCHRGCECSLLKEARL